MVGAGRGGRLVCWFCRWVVEVDEAPSNPLPAAQDPASRPRLQGDAAHPLPGSAPGIQVWAKVTDLLQLSFQEGWQGFLRNLEVFDLLI